MHSVGCSPTGCPRIIHTCNILHIWQLHGISCICEISRLLCVFQCLFLYPSPAQEPITGPCTHHRPTGPFTHVPRNVVEAPEKISPMQDGAPPHMAWRAQYWRKLNFPNFRERGTCPGNCRSLNQFKISLASCKTRSTKITLQTASAHRSNCWNGRRLAFLVIVGKYYNRNAKTSVSLYCW